MPAPQDPTQAGLNAAPGHPARGSVARACAGLAASLALLLVGATSAYAGEWVQVSCVNPNQSGAGSSGWSSFAAGGGVGSNNSTGCGPGNPAFALLSSETTVAAGSAETLQYTPPAGSTLNGGQLDIGMAADGHGANASGTAVAYTPDYSYDASNVFFQCAADLAPCAAGTNDFAGLLEIPGRRGGNLYLSAGCGSTVPGASCDEGASFGGWSLIQLWWANLRLSNNSTPSASGISGTLLSSEARGSRELVLTAADPAGPGVYRITVQADDETLYSATPDSNDGQCNVVGESSTALMFDASQPCKQNETVDLPIETTIIHDGQHTLKITVTDAAGNTSVVYDAPLTTDNAPADSSAPSIGPSGEVRAGSALSARHGEWAAPANTGNLSYGYQWEDCDAQGAGCQPIAGAEGASYTPYEPDVGRTLRVQVTASDSDGATSVTSAASAALAAGILSGSTISDANAPGASTIPNGTGASEGAQLRLEQSARISRTFGQRALAISGKLTNASAIPIVNATLQVSEQIAGQNSGALIAQTRTTATGSFTVHVPSGPSRRVVISYRAFSTDGGYAAQAQLQETVRAGVQMHITPRQTAPTGSIILAGQVAGPLPPSGVVVELLVHYYGAWQPFRDPHTDGSGHFRVRYQFQGAIGRYPFRAEVLGGQAGFPYADGASTPVAVHTG